MADEIPNYLSMNPQAPPDPNNLVSMMSKIAPHLDEGTKKTLVENSGNPEFLSRVKELAPQMAQAQSKAPAPKMGSQAKNTSTENSGTQRSSTLRDPDQINAAMDVMSQRPEYQAAQAADQASQDKLQQMMDQQPPGWIKPLANISDFVNHTHQADSIPGPESRNAMILKYQDDLDKRKQEMFKSLANSAAQFKTGSAQEKNNQIMQAMSGYGYGANTANARLAAIPIRAGQDFDKQTANMTRSIESLGRGDRILTDPSIPLTENALNLAQQDISAALTASGAPTDSKLAMDMQHSIAGIIQQAKTKWTGKYDPQKDDLRTQIPDIVNQIKKVLDAAREEYRDNVNRQSDQIGKTYEASFGAIPNLEQTVKDKQQYIKDRFPKSTGYSGTGQFQAPPQRTKELKDMTQSELDAYEASLHKGG